MVTSTNPVVQNALAARTHRYFVTNSGLGKIIGKCPSDVKAMIQKLDKILEVTEPNDTTDVLWGNIASRGWTFDDGKRAWVFNDSQIRQDIKSVCRTVVKTASDYDVDRSVNSITDAKMASDIKSMLAIAQKYAR